MVQIPLLDRSEVPVQFRPDVRVELRHGGLARADRGAHGDQVAVLPDVRVGEERKHHLLGHGDLSDDRQGDGAQGVHACLGVRERHGPAEG